MRRHRHLIVGSLCPITLKTAISVFTTMLAVSSYGIAYGQSTQATGKAFAESEEEKARPPKPTSSTTNATQPEQVTGRIKKVESTRLSVEESLSQKLHQVVVPNSADVTLNQKPAKLSDLRSEDYAHITMSLEMPNTAQKVSATRGQDPATVSPVLKVEANKKRVVTEPLKDNQGGLGIVISDSPHQGVLVLDVHKDTPAWNAGIETGDYVLGIDQREIVTPEECLMAIRSHEPGEAVKIFLWRNGKTRRGDIVLTTAAIARDREAVDDRALIIAETHGDDTVVIRRTPGRTERLDRAPDQPTVIVEKDQAVVVTEDSNQGSVTLKTQEVTIPTDHAELVKQYRILHRELYELRQELERLKKP